MPGNGVMNSRPDELTRALLRGSAIALIVTIAAQGVGFLLQLLLARWLGEVEFGYYSYAMAWLAVGLIAGKAGYDTALVRFVAEYEATNDVTRLGQVIAHGRHFTLKTSACVSLILVAAVLALAPEPTELRHVLLLVALLLPIAVYSEITAAVARGFRRVGVALAGDGVLRPAVVLIIMACVGAYWPAGMRASGATFAYILGTLGSIVLTTNLLRRYRGVPIASAGERSPASARGWNTVALPTMMANGSLVLLYSVDILMLGWLADTTESGYYNIASKIALLVLFAMNAAQAIAAPMLSAAFARGRQDDLRKVVGQMNLLAAVAAVPLSIGVIAFAGPLLGLLGTGYVSAAGCLQLLALMQLLNVFTGPVGTILSMSGNQALLVRLLGFGLVINALLNLALIPRFGAEGAAWSALIAHTAWNVAGVGLVWRRLQLDCTILSAFPARPLNR
jgi:O-antigen/teichoic acid export membrane protein